MERESYGWMEKERVRNRDRVEDRGEVLIIVQTPFHYSTKPWALQKGNLTLTPGTLSSLKQVFYSVAEPSK